MVEVGGVSGGGGEVFGCVDELCQVRGNGVDGDSLRC